MARIAVIDDDHDFHELMADMFADRGWELVSCLDAAGAFTMLHEERPDLVILDIRLNSARSGWEILTFLQLHPHLADIPVLVCSAAVPELSERAGWLQQHGVKILQKPFDIAALYEAVEEALEEPALHQIVAS